VSAETPDLSIANCEQARQRRLHLRELAEAANQPWSARRQEFYDTIEPDDVLALIAKADLADLLRERIVRAIAASEGGSASDAVQDMLDILQDTEGHGIDHD
jgi:ethanolamine utilization protein EutP (predicted NTPase)